MKNKPRRLRVDRERPLYCSAAQGAPGQSEDPSLIGRVVAERYRLVRRLGRGSMGEVYLADDLRLGQPVALKFLSPSGKRDARAQVRFLDEVRFARQVSHPHVCRIHDFGDMDGDLFVSMEHVDGEDLRTLLTQGPLPRDRAVEVSIQICRGLAAIHDRGFLHRDLKPANVMIDHRGQVRITDFGWAASASCESGAAPLDDDGVITGTPAYLAPESLLGRPATQRSDLYALGLLIHELFTGRKVYPKHALLMLKRRLEEASSIAVPPVEARLEQGLDFTVARVVLWCLATDPRERPASAEAVEAALRPEVGLEPGTLLATLVVSDPPGGSEEVLQKLLVEHGGREIATAQGSVWLFARPWGAVCFTVSWRQSSAPGADLVGMGIHLGQATLERRWQGGLQATGPDVDTVRQLAAITRPGQILLTPHAFDLARHHSVGEGVAEEGKVRWFSHGPYQLSGLEEPIEIFEVGLEDGAPFLAPACSEHARSMLEGSITGWRPAPGIAIPQRPAWRIERRLGAGGFGDVWLCRAAETGESRVFKFCYDQTRLSALRRETAIFRLLREELGDRPDITRVIDWNFDKAPYFLESEYALAGSLPEWAEGQGGLDRVPLGTRLEIVAQVATALAAAHSVGVLHKDVKPDNVLTGIGDHEEVRVQLCDFGIAAIIDRHRLMAKGGTTAGSTDSALTDTSVSGGTRLYLAPEILEGKPPSLHSDLFALGVMLYQVVVGDLTRALAPGWRRDVEDEILREDIAVAVDGSPSRRLSDAAQLAERLRSLDRRRAERLAEGRARRRAERARRQRRIMVVGLVTLGVIALMVGVMAWRVAREAERAEGEARAARAVVEFLVEMFETTDPFENVSTTPSDWRGRVRGLLDQAARRLDTELLDQPEVRARLINTVGRVYQRVALYDSAQVQFEKALTLRRTQLGRDHPAVAESLHDLAWLLHLRGDQDRAEALLRETLALRRGRLGEEHLYVANTLHDLAWVLQAKGDLEAAESLAREVLASKRRRLGSHDREVAASLNHLAFLLLEKGDLAAAEIFAREALAITRQLWTDHPDVADSLNGLARVLLAQGDAEAAEPLAREALEMRRRLLGAEHPAVAQSLHDLGMILVKMRDSSKAEELMEESLATYQRLFGLDHPGVAMNRNSLDALRRIQSRSESAP